MSDLHDGTLPETDDPFDLLGVPRSSDERELKRAYVRLIKRFRPDERPVEFRRVRVAFESARDALRYGAYFLDEGGSESELGRDDADASSAPDEPSTSQIAEESPERAFQGSLDRLERTQRADRPSEASCAPPVNEPENASELDLVAHRIRHGEDLSRSGAIYDKAVLDACWRQDLLRWELLREQPDRGLAATLFEAGLERDLLADHAHRVLEAIDCERPSGRLLNQDRMDEPALDRLVHRMIGLLAWTAPERSARLLAEEPPSDTDSSSLEWAELTIPLARSWQRVRAVRRPPRALDRLLRLGTLYRGDCPALYPEVLEAIRRDPLAWTEAADALHRENADLLAHLAAILRSWSFESPATLDPATEKERAATVLPTVVEALCGRARNRLMMLTLPPPTVVLLLLVFYFGVNCGTVIVGMLKFYLWFFVARDIGRSYGRRTVRPALALALVEGGISRRALGDAIDRQSTPISWIWPLREWLEDRALAHLELLGTAHWELKEDPTRSRDDALDRSERCAVHDEVGPGVCEECQRSICERCEGPNEIPWVCSECAPKRARRVSLWYRPRERELLLLTLVNLAVVGFVLLYACGALLAFSDLGDPTRPFATRPSEVGRTLLLVWVPMLVAAGLGTRRLLRWAFVLQAIVFAPAVLTLKVIQIYIGQRAPGSSTLTPRAGCGRTPADRRAPVPGASRSTCSR